MSKPALKTIVKEPISPLVVGQLWKPLDRRFADMPNVEIVDIGEPYMHLMAAEKQALVRDVRIRNVATNRISRARSDRFDGKNGGYAPVTPVTEAGSSL